MRKKFLLGCAMTAALAMLFVYACKKEHDGQPTVPDLTTLSDVERWRIIDSIIQSMHLSPTLPQKHELIHGHDTMPSDFVICRVETYEDVFHKQVVTIPNPANPFLPFEVYDINSLYNGGNQKIKIGRDGSKGVITVTTGSFSVSDTSGYQESEILNVISDLQNQISGNDLSQEIKVDVTEAYSANQIAAYLSFGGSCLWADYAASLNFESEDYKYKYVATVSISDFTAKVDGPTRPSDWFPTLTNTSILGQWSPVYVERVTYGKLLMLLIESNYSYAHVQSALSASFGGIGGGGYFDAGGDYQTLSTSSRIRVMAVGGTVSSVSKLFDGDKNSIKSYLDEMATDKTGDRAVPLFVQFKFLKDNSNATIVTATDPYKVRKCYTVQPGNYSIEQSVDIGYLLLPNVIQGDNHFSHRPYTLRGEVKIIVKNKREVWASFKLWMREGSNGVFGDTEATLDREIKLDDSRVPPNEEIIDFLSPKEGTFEVVVPGPDPHYVFEVPPAVFQPYPGPIRSVFANNGRDGNDFPSDGSPDRNFIKIFLNDIQVKTKKI